MSSKFEQLLDYLVNEETEKANELFHEIVVEKSRDIYESLIAEEEDESMDEAHDEEDESMDEAHDDEEDESMDESYEEETTESIYGEEEEDFPVQDQTDDFEDDTMDQDFGDEMGSDMGDDSAPADKGDIRDLEDALEELKAEFEALLAAEQNEEENEPGIHGEPSPLDTMDDEDGEESDEEDEEGEEDDEEGEEDDEGMTESRQVKSQSERMREYIEKVSVSMVDGEGVGSGRGDKAGQTGHDSGKSPVSSGSGKPQSGANAKNIVNDTSKHTEDGTRPTGKVGGLVKSGGDFVKAGTKNVASKASAKKPDGAKLSSVSKPGNKEFAGVGAATGGDKAGQTGSGDTKSPLSGAPNRAK